MASAAAVEEIGTARRKAGRPPASKNQKISRVTIIRTALRLAKTVPLQELSIVMVAKAMGVTPALIHYYVGGRDWLTSGVMNAFYREVLARWPERTGDAETDILAAARVLYDHFVRYAGIVSYTLLNSRFRTFQLVEEGERDYGVELLERFTGRVMQAGCSAERTGIYAHLLMEFTMSSAHGAVSHRYPGEHRAFLEARTATLDRDKFPNIHFTSRFSMRLDAEAAFREGSKLFLLGLGSEQLPTGRIIDETLLPPTRGDKTKDAVRPTPKAGKRD